MEKKKCYLTPLLNNTKSYTVKIIKKTSRNIKITQDRFVNV